MHIELSSEHYHKLAGQASAAGFADVESFVVSLAEAPLDPRGQQLSSAALNASVAQLNASFADEAAGRVEDFRTALRDVAPL